MVPAGGGAGDTSLPQSLSSRQANHYGDPGQRPGQALPSRRLQADTLDAPKGH